MSLSISEADFLTAVGISTAAGTFGLHATRLPEPPVATQNTLDWTWPANMLTAITAQTLPFWHLTLQYSTSASYRPSPAVAYAVASRTAPQFDVKWTQIWQLNFSGFLASLYTIANPIYVHAWASHFPVAYRLILNYAHPGDPVLPPYGEMTWNVPLVVPVHTFTAATSGQPRLNWTAPDPSWWP